MQGWGGVGDSQVFVGIDVSKICLDVAARPTGEGWQVANDAAGIGDLAQQLTGMSPSLVVLEATGGLEREFAAGLAVAGLPVAVVNPKTWPKTWPVPSAPVPCGGPKKRS
jgi:transposase